uniref:hypothetical protein n=1 Tax=uncultured Christiangramia sp. TaxID=503836 RepID=UPI00262F256E|nr:hypothetical protein [uncultured Christiangramia sp.]
MRNLFTILLLAVTMGVSANNLSSVETYELKENITNTQDINPELTKMLKSGEIESLTISYNDDFSCTLSAEVSYNGAAVKLSITADTCEEAGAGIAQAVRGFYNELK